jgi:hypothetical protein
MAFIDKNYALWTGLKLFFEMPCFKGLPDGRF